MNIKMYFCIYPGIRNSLFTRNIYYRSAERLCIADLKITRLTFIGKIGYYKFTFLNFLLNSSNKIFKNMFFIYTNSNATVLADKFFNYFKTNVVLFVNSLLFLASALSALYRHNDKNFNFICS